MVLHEYGVGRTQEVAIVMPCSGDSNSSRIYNWKNSLLIKKRSANIQLKFGALFNMVFFPDKNRFPGYSIRSKERSGSLIHPNAKYLVCRY